MLSGLEPGRESGLKGKQRHSPKSGDHIPGVKGDYELEDQVQVRLRQGL